MGWFGSTLFTGPKTCAHTHIFIFSLDGLSDPYPILLVLIWIGTTTDSAFKQEEEETTIEVLRGEKKWDQRQNHDSDMALQNSISICQVILVGLEGFLFILVFSNQLLMHYEIFDCYNILSCVYPSSNYRKPFYSAQSFRWKPTIWNSGLD